MMKWLLVGSLLLVAVFMLFKTTDAAGGTPDCTDSLTETSYTYHCEDAVYRGGLSGSRTIVFPAGAQRGVTRVWGQTWSAGDYATFSPDPANWGNLLPFVQNNTLTISWSSGRRPGYENSAISWTVTVSFKPRPVMAGCSANPNPVTLTGGQATTTLTGTGSDPAGGVIGQYQWDFGDGTTAITDARLVPRTLVGRSADDVPPARPWGIPHVRAGGGGGLSTGPPVKFSATPATVTFGQTSTLSWSVDSNYTDTFTLVATNAHGSVSKTITVPIAGFAQLTPPLSTPLVAMTGSSRRSWLPVETAFAGGGGGEPPPDSPTILFFDWELTNPELPNWPKPRFVPNGTTVRLKWSVLGHPFPTIQINGAPITGDSIEVAVGHVQVTGNFTSGALPRAGSQVVTPGFGSTYTLTATDPRGTTTKTIGVGILKPPAVHTYTQPGTYTVTVTAVSSNGNTGIGSCIVTVAAPAPPPPSTPPTPSPSPSPTPSITVQGSPTPTPPSPSPTPSPSPSVSPSPTPTPLIFEGPFAAPRIGIDHQGNLIIRYDSQIQASPPPGFTNLVPPAVEEGS